MLLTFGIAMAANPAEAEQAQPAVSNNPENQSQPKEESATTTNPSQGNAATGKEEPDCN
jgi:hypothetical protein